VFILRAIIRSGVQR